MDGIQTGLTPGDHKAYMRVALDLAREVIPKSTNFCVGAVLVDYTTSRILSTGYTNELPGNTHAEQCAFTKFDSTKTSSNGISAILYTTMEPCNKRASGNPPCTDTILAASGQNPPIRIKTVFVGVQEPETFVSANEGRRKLQDAGIGYIHVAGLEEEILRVATAGHVR